MRFSLVMSTIGRSLEVGRFLRHLALQPFRDLELIVADQNEDDRLDSILAPFKSEFPIIHLRSSQKGVSRGRNLGLRHVRGDIIAFPDDDCWYPEGLLETVDEFLEQHPQWNGVTGRCLDERGKVSMGRMDKHGGPVGFINVWLRLTSFTLFVRTEAAEAIGDFDETLGVGAGTPWGAAEEMDYAIRLFKKNFKLYYDPNIVVHHPVVVTEFNDKATWRHFSYGRGMGRVLRLHGYPLFFVLWLLIRPFGGGLLAACGGNFSKARYHFKGFWGRLLGWCSRVG